MNEYITSKPDLLIYNAHFTSHLGAVYIDLEANIDVLFQNDELSAEEVLITGCAGEVKVEQIGANGENECFYNMFSQGTNLAMKAISIQGAYPHRNPNVRNCSCDQETTRSKITVHENKFRKKEMLLPKITLVF